MNRYEALAHATHVYIGRLGCGCVVAVCTEIPGYPKDTAKDVAEFIREGYTVERITFEQYRGIHLGCVHVKPKQKEAGLFAEVAK